MMKFFRNYIRIDLVTFKSFFLLLLLVLFISGCNMPVSPIIPIEELPKDAVDANKPGDDKKIYNTDKLKKAEKTDKSTKEKNQGVSNVITQTSVAYKDIIAGRIDLNNPAKDAQHPKYTIDKEPLSYYFDREQHRQTLIFTMNAGEIPLQIINKKTKEKLEGVEWFLTDRKNNKNFTAKESESNELIKIKDGKLIIGSVPHNTENDVAYGSIIGIYKENNKEYLYRLNYRIINETQKKEKENLEKLNEVVAEIIKNTENLTEYQKVQYVHDYLVDNIVYDYAYRGRPNQYLSLVKGRAVCEGYARAFKYLMDAMGVVSEYESGESVAGYHAWNIVKIEDGWYYLDTTWGRYQAFTKVDASNLDEVEVFLRSTPYPIDLIDALTKLGYTADEYLDWKKNDVKQAIEVLERILATKASKSELENNFTRNYNYFLIDPETFHNTHGGARKYKDGRTMGTKYINKNPEEQLSPIKKESTVIDAPTEVKLVGISNTTGKLTNLNGKNIEYFMHNSKDGWQMAVEGAEIDIESLYGSGYDRYILLREKRGDSYSKMYKITAFWQDYPQWIKMNGNKVSELSGTMEYRKVGSSWQDLTGTEMVLAKGSYEFRLKGDDNLIPSQAFEVEIK